MADCNEPKPAFSRNRRWLKGLNSLLAIAAFLALVAMINYLAAGHFVRLPWARNSAIKLSPLTVSVLQALTNDVKITLFFQPHGDEEDLYSLASSLLAEYQNLNPKRVQVRTLDDTRFPGEAKALLAQHNLTELKDRDFSRNFILFECNGHPKIYYAKALASYDLSPLMSGKSREVRRNAFRGEMLFTSAIFALSNAQQIKTYFIYGHGEHNPLSGSSEDGNAAGDYDSYSKLASLLKEEINSDWQRLSLQGTNGVPGDCQLMIIAGPRRGFSQAERLKIDAYLKQGGRLLALLSDDTSLAPVLRNWGIGIGETVEEHDGNFRNAATDRDFLTAGMAPHPIMNPLLRDHLAIRIVSPRAVYQLRSLSKTPGAPEVTPLAVSSTNATSGNEKGSFALITAVEQGVIKGARGGGTKIVAAGDSSFLSDKMIHSEEANHYFAYSAINWLLGGPDALFNEIGPRPITEYKLFMSKSQSTTVRWLFLAGMPGAVLFVGVLVWLRRRS